MMTDKQLAEQSALVYELGNIVKEKSAAYARIEEIKERISAINSRLFDIHIDTRDE